MKVKELYDNQDDYFIKPGISDDGFQYMPELEPFLCENFKERSMGLACDFYGNDSQSLYGCNDDMNYACIYNGQ